LEQLDPRVVVLSEHVDYWDRQGWRDPFSSAALSERQEAYRRRFHAETVYTPEMVVDGAAGFSGGDAQRAVQEIDHAVRQPKAPIRVTRAGAGVQVDVDASPASAGIFLALADDSGGSQVAAGENKGRTLHFVAIVRSIRKIGAVKRGAGFSETVKLPEGAAAQRVVVFVQEPDQGRVFGAAMLPPLRG